MVPTRVRKGCSRVVGPRVVDAHLVESSLLVTLETSKESRRGLGGRPQIEHERKEVCVEDEGDDPLHDGGGRRDLLAAADLIRSGRVVDRAVAPRIENGEDDGADQRADDDNELEDGVSHQMSSFGVVLLEVENLQALEDCANSDADDEHASARPMHGRVVLVVEAGEEDESDRAEDAEDDGKDVVDDDLLVVLSVSGDTVNMAKPSLQEQRKNVESTGDDADPDEELLVLCSDIRDEQNRSLILDSVGGCASMRPRTDQGQQSCQPDESCR